MSGAKQVVKSLVLSGVCKGERNVADTIALLRVVMEYGFSGASMLVNLDDGTELDLKYDGTLGQWRTHN